MRSLLPPFRVAVVIGYALIACSDATSSPLPPTPAPPQDLPEDESLAPSPDPGVPLTFVGTLAEDPAAVNVIARVRSVVEAELASALVRPWFRGRGIRVRVLGPRESMTTVPEFVETSGRFGAPVEAYGLTLPERIGDDFFFAVKQSKWLEQTTMHEMLHVIAFAADEAGADLPRRMASAYKKSTIVLEASSQNAHENLAYKGQHYLSGNGAVLARAVDPILDVLTDLFPTPLFPNQAATSSELLSR